MSQNVAHTRPPATIEERIGNSIDRTVTRELSVIDTGGGGTLSFGSMSEVLEFSKIMAVAGIAVRKHLRGNPGACAAITMQALRWNMDPFAVANKSYPVNDQIAYESQLIAAVVNTRAPLRERLQCRYEGEGGKRTCIVYGTLAEESAPREVSSPEFEKIQPKNSPLWKTDPDQQLFYYTSRLWARRIVPEILLGVYDPEELADARALASARDITPAAKPQELLEQATTKAPNLAERAAALHPQDGEGPDIEAGEHPPEYRRFDLIDETGEVKFEALGPGFFVSNYCRQIKRLTTSDAVETFIENNADAVQVIIGEGLVEGGTALLAEAQEKARARVATSEEPGEEPNKAEAATSHPAPDADPRDLETTPPML